MLLAIDVGNSSISLGLFDLNAADPRPTPALTAKLSAATGRTADEYAVIIRGLLTDKGYHGAITAAVMGSVVPQLTHTLEAAVEKLGADIVTNASAAVKLYGAPVIFLDFGTATVCGAVNLARELVGVSISPGVSTSLEGLRAAAAQIPYMELKAPDTALGKNTTAAIRSGLVLGTACMIDGMIERIKEELKLPPNAALPIVATGGLAELVLPACTHEIAHEPDLTLLGLYFIYKATAEREAKKGR